MIPRFRNRQIAEAQQLSSANRKNVAEWCGGWYYDSNSEKEMYVSTDRGGRPAIEGDWIVKIGAEFQVLSSVEFAEQYEAL